ncbi:MAG TPA: GNAT family N-acetyltransferase [Longimicrobium sp.]|nr:GNAT family N-acetyltransferase [Longimicrobium sp.]
MTDFETMAIADVPEALELWTASEGVGLRGADSPEELTKYLARNPGLSLVARDGGRMVGAVLCGHDGRRGYLHHLAVAASHRRRGIGRALVERCLDGLRRDGIAKCHLMVYHHNAEGQAFWRGTGWHARDDILLMSRNLTDDANA